MRITVAVVVLIWLIPTAGVLVTSFRPEALADSTGWWTSLAHPFRAGEWTLENYRRCSTPAASRTPSSTAWR